MDQYGSILVLILFISAAAADTDKNGATTVPTSAPLATTPMSKFTSTLKPKPTESSSLYGPPDPDYMPALEMSFYRGSIGNNTYYYDTRVRPNLFYELDIYTQFYLSGITHVNEKEGSIVLTGILLENWEDKRLTWDPLDFGNITTAIFEGYKIWTPMFFHNGNDFLRQSSSVLYAEVSYEGKVYTVVSFHEETPCMFDMTKFPRDSQNCYVQLYHSDPLVKLHATGAGQLTLGASIADVGQPRHVAWEITNVTMEAHPQIAGTDSGELYWITISMTRHANFFLRLYVAPVCFLLLLIPVIFLLPPDSSEKLTYGAVLLFAMLFVSQSVESIYPPYTDTTPYLIQLTTASGALLFLCILLTGLISSAERIGRKRAMPPWVKKYIVGTIGPYLLVKENDGVTHGTVHIKATPNSDRDFIVQTEQSVDLEERNGGFNQSELSSAGDGDNNAALLALVNELKQSRLQSKAQDDWTNVFTILNRFLFLLTLIIGIIIILCFA